MKFRSLTAIALGLAASASTPLAFAQSTTSTLLGESSAATTLLESSGMKDVKQIRASKLIGINVTSKDGENLGQVQDLIMNPETGKIRFALKSAPSWSQTENMDQPDYVIRIYRFYELEPQSDVGGFSDEQSGQGSGSSNQSDSSLQKHSDQDVPAKPDRE